MFTLSHLGSILVAPFALPQLLTLGIDNANQPNARGQIEPTG